MTHFTRRTQVPRTVCIGVGVIAALLALRVSAAGVLLMGNRFPLPASNVLSIDPASPSIIGVFGQGATFDPGPGVMAQDSLGRVYVMDPNPDQVQRFDSTGKFIDVFITSGFGVNGLYYGMTID